MANSYALIKTVDRPTFTLAWLSNNLELNKTVGQPTLVATMNDWNLNTTVNQPTLEAEMISGDVYTLNEVILRPNFHSTMISGRNLGLSLTMRPPSLVATITSENYLSLVKTVNAVSLVATLYQDNYLTLDSLIRRPNLVAFWNNDVINSTTTTTYVINTMNSAHSEYSNYGFNSFFRLANSYYGINSTGVYRLSGDLDGTTQIDTEVDTPLSSFDKQGMKACSDAIILGRLNGDMEVCTVVDEQEELQGLVVRQDGKDGLHRIRVKVPKGLKGATWQFKLKNMNGSNFSINSLEVFLRELQRVQ